jgi:hypothetical protein
MGPYPCLGSRYTCSSAIHEMRSLGFATQGFQLGTYSDCEGYHNGAIHWIPCSTSIDKNS